MRKPVFILWVLLSSLCSKAQQKNVTRIVGMGSGNVWSLVQDKQGYMWFGVQEGKAGLYKYNGSTLKSYTHDSTKANSLAQNSVRGLYVDDSGFVWIASYGGVDRFDPEREVFTNFRHIPGDSSSLSKDSATHIVAEKSGNLWIGTRNGLNLLDRKTGKVKRFYHDPNDPGSLGSNNIVKVYIDRRNQLWVGTVGGGLNLYNRETGKFRRFMNNPADPTSLRSNTVTAIMEDSRGLIWIGTLDNHLHTLNSSSFTLTYYAYNTSDPEALSSPPTYAGGLNYIPFILEDNNGLIWIGSLYSGIKRYNPVTGKAVHLGGMITGNRAFVPGSQEIVGFNESAALSCIQSSDGLVWVGTTAGNVYNFPPENKQLPYYPLNTIAVNSFYKDKKGALWIALQEGLVYKPENGKSITYRHNPKQPNSISNNIINSIRSDSKGNLWLGTGGGGVSMLDPTTGKFTNHLFSAKENTDSNTVTLMHIDGDSILWAASTTGLRSIHMSSGAVKSFFNNPDDKNSLVYNDVYVFAGKNNDLWVGTSRGLDKLEKSENKFTHYLPAHSIFALKSDHKGTIWAGTEKGLYVYNANDDNFELYADPITGIKLGVVLSIVEDREKNLWIASTETIYKINSDRNRLQILGPEVGVRRNGLLLADNYVADDGTIYMGDDHGYYAFKPGEVDIKSNQPIFYISAFSMGNKEVQPGKNSPIEVDISIAKEIQLAHNQNSFSFEFTALNYNSSENIRYRYQLENYDSSWQDLGQQNKAYFFNLSPGEYILRVRAVSSTGAWSEKSISVFISQPWWQTWWGILLLVTGLLLIISIATYYRSRQLRRQNKLLEEKVNHRTVQLKTSLENLKATQSQLVQSEKMASLGELTAGIAHEIQNPLNFINNFAEINRELLAEMREELENNNMDAAKSIALDIDANESKIYHHGKRADGIVKSMLQHSRSSNPTKESVDINKLADEYVRLAYHGLRAKDKSFNATIDTRLEDSLPPVQAVAQDIGRVILNLLTNAFYAVKEKKKQEPAGYEPLVSITTRSVEDTIEITVTDNGNGIPEKVIEKIFQPFFTTKPTGQGTGLGLSMSYDIVTKAHGGELKVTSREGEGTAFTIVLPIK